MATQNDSTIAGLSRSILKAAREADEIFADDQLTAKLEEIQNAAAIIHDANIAAEDEPETPRDQQRIVDDLNDRIRWAKAAIDMIACGDDLDEPISDSADGAAEYLRQARELLHDLPWQSPARPRDLSNANEREDEKRDLVRRMLKLSHDEANEVTFCHIFISSADDPAEGLRLLDKYPLSYVHRFMSVQKDEAKEKPQAEVPKDGAA